MGFFSSKSRSNASNTSTVDSDLNFNPDLSVETIVKPGVSLVSSNAALKKKSPFDFTTFLIIGILVWVVVHRTV